MTGNKSSNRKELLAKDNFSEWYDNVLLEAKIVDDRYPVKGFSVYTGWGMSIAKRIIGMLEEGLEKNGNEPMQFPVVIPEDAFQKEEDHIEGFSGEVFWITHAGENELERKLILRPTSETAIYPMFKLWMRSHQDLPIRMHQTCNVYRYETKATRPLYRGREFLWNEGHTAHVNYDDAEKEVKNAAKIYRSVYDRLGLSYIMLKRPDFDKFAGADYSIAFDTWNPDGKVNQIGTVHQLGYNFAKAFELTYEDPNGEQATAITTCYGMGFGRTLAATISHHGDDHGLVLPPKVAPKQLVIIPILFKKKGELTINYAKRLEAKLQEAGIRVVLDDDTRFNPGDKYYKWEMYGVPLRLEVGPREAENKKATLVRRDNFEKIQVEEAHLVDKVHELFQEIFMNLKKKSKAKLDELLADAYNMDELKSYMDERRIVRVNWCGDADCAMNIKDLVSGEIRGTRWDIEEKPTGNCILCGDEGKYIAYVSRTY
ncbi:MAG: proline--tRNA ligase [Candidatus Bathyarchaeota archaeon]|nr:proline--tRNA ligase [Candidatus Bathyarchaeota archaeon]